MIGVSAEPELSLSDYQRRDRDEVLAFTRDVAGASVGVRLARQWDWKYGPESEADPEPAGVLLLRSGSRLVGMYGWRRLRCSIGGTIRRVTLSSDVLVHTEFRHRPRTGFTDRFLRDHPLIFGWGKRRPPRAARSSSIVAPKVVPWVRPLPPRLGLSWSAGRGGVAIDLVAAFDARIDPLWQRAMPSLGVALVRDAAYLGWRFDRRPDAEYVRLIAGESGTVRGYAVLRLPVGDSARIGSIVDLLVEPGAERRVLVPLLRAAVVRLRSAGALVAGCVVTAPAYRWPLYQLGFVPMPLRPWGHLVLSATPGDPDAPAFLDPSAWFSTMGDGDLELVR